MEQIICAANFVPFLFLLFQQQCFEEALLFSLLNSRDSAVGSASRARALSQRKLAET